MIIYSKQDKTLLLIKRLFGQDMYGEKKSNIWAR